jgi:hypothetical protein
VTRAVPSRLSGLAVADRNHWQLGSQSSDTAVLKMIAPGVRGPLRNSAPGCVPAQSALPRPPVRSDRELRIIDVALIVERHRAGTWATAGEYVTKFGKPHGAVAEVVELDGGVISGLFNEP